jgi:hypothetical protein
MIKKIGIAALLIISIGIFVHSDRDPQQKTVKLTNRELVKKSKNGNCSLKVFYPQVGGLPDAAVEKKINSELKSQFISDDDVSDIENCQPEDRYNIEVTYCVKLNMQNILSIRIKHYMVTPGGGSTLLKGITFNVEDGESNKYEDLFRSDTNYISKINALVWGNIEEGDPTFESKMNTTDYEFYITENKLVILPFVSPQMAREVPINLSEIADICNPEGPLYPLIKR